MVQTKIENLLPPDVNPDDLLLWVQQIEQKAGKTTRLSRTLYHIGITLAVSGYWGRCKSCERPVRRKSYHKLPVYCDKCNLLRLESYD